MRDQLLKLLDKAYVPYSHYPVAALLIMKDGEVITGVNVENASYGATICAERNAILRSVTLGYKKGDIASLHVMVKSPIKAYPCFICRQVIEEFFTGDEELVLYTTNDIYYEKISDIIVKPFNKENLS